VRSVAPFSRTTHDAVAPASDCEVIAAGTRECPEVGRGGALRGHEQVGDHATERCDADEDRRQAQRGGASSTSPRRRGHLVGEVATNDDDRRGGARPASRRGGRHRVRLDPHRHRGAAQVVERVAVSGQEQGSFGRRQVGDNPQRLSPALPG
jgi:hypothetical protein